MAGLFGPLLVRELNNICWLENNSRQKTKVKSRAAAAAVVKKIVIT